MSTSMKVTIKQVAQKAGVGIGTVSRVLNRVGYFDPDTARKVQEAAQSLGYRRNVHWRRLSSNASRTLCFLLGNRDALNSMQMKMLVACEQVSNARGYDLVFARFSYATDARAGSFPLPRLLADEGVVDGAILIGRHSANLIQALDRLSIPWVMMGNNYDGDFDALDRNVISYEDESGCYEGAAYLARQGHRRIAFVGNGAFPWFARRRAGYERAIAAHGLRPIAITQDWGASGIEYGRLAATELLRQREAPTAILAANDEIAAGVWKELVHRGIRIPREISLCGFGDREEFQILEPSLTSIAVFPEKLGAELARMMLERLDKPGTAVGSRAYPCRLVERASCAPPPSRTKAARA
jgi:LacI family transcriptional regulator